MSEEKTDGSTPFITKTALMKTFRSTPHSYLSITIVLNVQLKPLATLLARIYIYIHIMTFFRKTENMEKLEPLLR